MHILGKVFAWMIVFTTMAALILSSRALDIRQAWQKRVVDQGQKLDKIESGEGGIASRRAKLGELQAEYDRIMVGWGRYWETIAATDKDPSGALVLGIGPPDLTDKDAQGNAVTPVIYAFQPLADGGFEYVGEFKAVRLDVGKSTFLANWRVRPGDVEQWNNASNWRVRTLIPDADKARFTDLETHLIVEDEFLAATRSDLARQEGLLELANSHLALRIKEIEGFPELKGQEDKLPLDLIQGVLASSLQEEEARNAALENADRLRRALQETEQSIERITQRNARLVKSLNRQEPEVSQR